MVNVKLVFGALLTGSIRNKQNLKKCAL